MLVFLVQRMGHNGVDELFSFPLLRIIAWCANQLSCRLHTIKAVHVWAHSPSSVDRLWFLVRLLDRFVVFLDRLHHPVFIPFDNVLKCDEVKTQFGVFLEAINHPCECDVGHRFEVTFF